MIKTFGDNACVIGMVMGLVLDRTQIVLGGHECGTGDIVFAVRSHFLLYPDMHFGMLVGATIAFIGCVFVQHQTMLGAFWRSGSSLTVGYSAMLAGGWLALNLVPSASDIEAGYLDALGMIAGMAATRLRFRPSRDDRQSMLISTT